MQQRTRSSVVGGRYCRASCDCGGGAGYGACRGLRRVEDMEVGFTQTARTDEGSAEATGEVVDAKQVDVDEFVGESLFTSERTSESTTGEYNALPTQEV